MSEVLLQREMPRKPGYPVTGALVLPTTAAYPSLEDAYILDHKRWATGIGNHVEWPYTNLKLPGVTAIPQGVYRLCIVRSTRFGRYMPAICDVPNFTGILIHPGNWQEDVQGCIAVGRNITNGRQISESAAAFEEVFTWLDSQSDPVWIVIRNPK